MRIPAPSLNTLSFLALGSLVLVLGIAVTPLLAGDKVSLPVSGERQWLSIGQVHSKLEAAGYRHVEKIERERGRYEARAIGHNGERVKLSINPQTGEISARRSHHDDQRHDTDRNASEQRRPDSADSADCNKRRCRDDLPATSSSGKSAN
jgi:hypothetical protein